MKLSAFKTINVSDQLLQRVQNNTENSFKPLLDNILGFVSISPKMSLKSGLNSVPHSLGAIPTGYIIIRQRGPAFIYDGQDDNATPQSTFYLVSSADVVVDVLFF